MNPTADTPDVIGRPPLIFGGAVVLGLILEWLFPIYLLSVVFYGAARIIVGILIVGAGLALVIAAFRAMLAAGTNVPTWQPSLNLATAGVFRYLRNPIYAGFTLIVAGLAIALASDWMLVTLVIAVLVVHYGVVLREEAYLERKFGEPYRQFKARVPRYGWPEK
jgi:protein-S-isoprenylcysteine O-methyltransferase Ste14